MPIGRLGSAVAQAAARLVQVPFLGTSPHATLVAVVERLHTAAVEEAARAKAAKAAAADEEGGTKRWAKGTGYGTLGYEGGDYDDEWWGEGRQDTTSIIPQSHRDTIAALNAVVRGAPCVLIVHRAAPR